MILVFKSIIELFLWLENVTIHGIFWSLIQGFGHSWYIFDHSWHLGNKLGLLCYSIVINKSRENCL